jgi:hypothetical protein
MILSITVPLKHYKKYCNETFYVWYQMSHGYINLQPDWDSNWVPSEYHSRARWNELSYKRTVLHCDSDRKIFFLNQKAENLKSHNLT